MLRPLARFARFCRTFACPPILSSARVYAPAGVRTRLSLESLDARVVPAIYTWTGMYGSDATLLANWAAGDPVNELPGGDDTIIFNYVDPKLGTPNCDGLVSGGAVNGLSFADMQLWGNYNGTVTFGSALTTGAYSQDGGATAQTQFDHELIVTGSFTWTGGVLNNTAVLSNVTITGSSATALFAPVGAGTVYTGNNIILAAGAQADFEAGTYTFTNNGEVNVGDDCGADVNVVTITSTVKYVGVKQINVTGADALFRVTGPGTFDGTGVPLYNSDGLVDIVGKATVKLGGAVTVLGNTFQSSYYQNGTSGRLHIQNGSNLDVENTARITDGVLKTFYNSNLPDNVTDQTATLTGSLSVSGGIVEISAKELLLIKRYGTFFVTETVNLTGGTYVPGINSTTSGTNDHWESGSNFTVAVGNTATLAPRNSNGVNTVANGVWNIIKSRNGTYLGTFATNNLQYTAGPPAMSYTFNTGGSPVNQVNLTS